MFSANNILKKFNGFYGEYCYHEISGEKFKQNSNYEKSNNEISACDQFPFNLIIDFEKTVEGERFESSTLSHDSVTAFIYGEIYNLEQLDDILSIKENEKQEVSLSQRCCLLYKKFGFEFAKKINGIFSIVLYDKKEKTLLLIADRFGMARPIYFRAEGELTFSNSLKKIFRTNKSDVSIDHDALALFLKYSYIPAPRTILKGVEKLNHGEMLICVGSHIKKKRYFTFEESSTGKLNRDADDIVDEYIDVLEKSVKRKLYVDNSERMGCFLSGGLDSSATVAIASKYEDKKIRTFGIGFNDSKIDERPFARIVSQHFDVPFQDYVFSGDEIENLPQVVWGIEEPFLENGLFLTYAGIKSASGKVDAVLAGDGADQLFGTGGFAGGSPIALRYILDKVFLNNTVSKLQGFTKNRLFYKDNFYYKMKVMFERATDFNDWFYWGFDNFELKKLLIESPGKEALNVFDNKIKAGSDFSEYYNTATIRQDIEHYVCQNVIVKSFRISDLLGVTVREVYLDNEVIDFLLKINLELQRKGKITDYLRRKTTTKYLHRLSMKDILPDAILNKPKQGGFVPMSYLLSDKRRRKSICSYIIKSTIINNLCNMKYVKSLLSEYEALCHRPIYWFNHRDAMSGKVLSLLAIGLWYDIFFEKKYLQCPKEHLSEFLNE